MAIGRTVRLFNYGGEVELTAEIMNDKSFCVSMQKGSGLKLVLTKQKEIEKFIDDFNELYERVKMEVAK